MFNDTHCSFSSAATVDLWGTVGPQSEVRLLGLILEVQCVAVEAHDLAVGQTMTVGRDRDSHCTVISDCRLSRSHFSIECRSDGAFLTDLRSKNGTFVNGISVKAKTLCDGDEIIAGTTVFVVRFLTV